MKSSPSIWRYVVNGKILSIFMAFLENMNFTQVTESRSLWLIDAFNQTSS